jgi:hypothetical protein
LNVSTRLLLIKQAGKAGLRMIGAQLGGLAPREPTCALSVDTKKVLLFSCLLLTMATGLSQQPGHPP